MIGSLAFEQRRRAIGNRSLSRSGGNILRSGDPADRPNDDRLAVSTRETWEEDTQTAVEMLRGMMVTDTQRAVMLGQQAVPDQDAPEIVSSHLEPAGETERDALRDVNSLAA